MKRSKTKNKKLNARGMTRREFVGTTALAAAGVRAGAPAILRGRNLNDKLDIAFIACGGRAKASLSELTIVPGRSSGRGRGDAAASGAPHPDENVVILCGVNDFALDEASVLYPKAKRFNDLRKIFDDPSGFDAVVVSTA